MDTSRNALRERTRVKSLRIAFQRLQSCLPTVPPNTKLSKLDILILATNYISYLGSALTQPQLDSKDMSYFKLLHPIKVSCKQIKVIFCPDKKHSIYFLEMANEVSTFCKFQFINFKQFAKPKFFISTCDQ
jgi:transcription factor 23